MMARVTTDRGLDEACPLYGCMALGGASEADTYGPAEIAAAERAIEAALEIGITSFDHADIYGSGKAESVFGEILARSPGLRARIQIQTKCGIRLAAGHAPGMYDLRASSIVQRAEDSLSRLGIDAIDVLLLHRADPLADPIDVAEALTSLHRQGLVRQFGVSNMSTRQIGQLQAQLDLPLVANQLEMSLHRRDWLEAGVLINTAEAAANGFPLGTIEYCRAEGISLQAWGSMAQGRYSGRQQTPTERVTAQLVRSLAEAKDTTPEAIVLWWLQRHPARVSPVIGSTNPSRIRACRDAVTRTPALTHEEWYELWITARGAPLP
jgi:predicted oxidoreductase